MDRPPGGAPPPGGSSADGAGGKPSGRGGRSNNRFSRARRSNRKRGGGTASSSSIPRLQLPQIKVTLRHIGDVKRYGTPVQMLDMITALVEAANDKHVGTNAALLPIQLDPVSVQRIVREQELVAAAAAAAAEAEAAAAAEAAKQKEAEAEADNGDDDQQPDNAAEAAAMDEQPDMPEKREPEATKQEKTEAAANGGNEPSSTFAEVTAVKSDNASKDSNSNNPVVTARVMYVVPPKISKRRGEKHGCAYLVLSPPPPPPPQQQQPPTTTGATEGEEQKVSPPVLTQAERSRAVAKARFLMLKAVDAMSGVAQEDAKSQQKYAGCIVEQSLSIKTWKDRDFRRDRREGTIEQTSDYRKFIQNAEKAKEERLARPKPTPGGGDTAAAAASADTDENGQQLSAIVLHLRAKRAEQKAKRKKASASANKKKSSRASKESRSSSKRASSKKGKSSRSRKEQKGGKRSRGAAAAAPAPQILLKPGEGAARKVALNGKG